MSLLSELLDIVNHGEAPDIGELQAGDFVHSHYFQVVSVIRKHAAQPTNQCDGGNAARKCLSNVPAAPYC